jgi:programmed cell death 6-interacting protein
MVRNNLKYELLNILFNLAALYSHIGVSSPRTNTEGLKTAASYFSQAAGVLSHMQTAIVPELRMSDPPEDMDTHTLEALIQLFLAQSQECFWQKAVMDGYRDASIAKLAARVSDLYDLAAEAGRYSHAISRAWLHHMSAKHHHFAAAAQCRAAADCLEKRKFGEEIARINDALNCINEGLKETRSGLLNRTVAEDMQSLKGKLEDDLKRAEKDNDVIYLETVPSKADLKPLDRANLAIAKVPPQVANPYDSLGDNAEFGPALFSRLVPFSVHVATTIYEERRDRLVNTSVIEPLETLTEALHTKLAALGLPGSLQALEKPLGLPHTLSQHAEEIRRSDAIGRIQKSLADLDKLRAADTAVIDEARQILAAEEQEDKALRLKYGTDRWARPPSRDDAEGKKIWQFVQQIDGFLATSMASDNLIREKFESVEHLLKILAGPERGLLDFVPSSRRTEIPEPLRPVIGRLRGAYNDVLRLESRRRRVVEALRDKSRSDDIRPDILKEAARLERTYPTTAIVPAHFEDFFEKRLDRLYEPDLESLDRESGEQDRLLTEVTRINREFEGQRKSMGDKGQQERAKTLQQLDNAFFKYKEIVHNLEQGRTFYNDLSRTAANDIRDPAKQWANRRRAEASKLEEWVASFCTASLQVLTADRELLMPPLAALSISRTTPVHSPPTQAVPSNASSYFPPQPQPAFPQQYASQRPQPIQEPPEAQIQSWASPNMHSQQPHAATPQGVWSPDMGITFGGPSGASASSSSNAGGGRGGTWNPSSGLRFG